MTVQLNQPVQHLFRVTDVFGANVTGLVAGNFTLDLKSGSPGSFATATESVTITEEGSGLYWASFTPTVAAGEYVFNVTHATHIVTPSSFQTTVVGPTAVVGPYLTTLARVKESLFPGDSNPPSSYDAQINSIIAEVTHRIRNKLDNRSLFEATFVEYIDGSGHCDLILREGPLVSVASINEVSYETDSVTGALNETLTLVKAGEYFLKGLRADNVLGRGVVERRGAVWTAGQRNYKVTYDAGFATVPGALQLAATNSVLSEINNRPGLDLVWLGDYRMETTDPIKVDRALELTIAPFLDWN